VFPRSPLSASDLLGYGFFIKLFLSPPTGRLSGFAKRLFLLKVLGAEDSPERELLKGLSNRDDLPADLSSESFRPLPKLFGPSPLFASPALLLNGLLKGFSSRAPEEWLRLLPKGFLSEEFLVSSLDDRLNGLLPDLPLPADDFPPPERPGPRRSGPLSLRLGIRVG
jgi:hypothetical protein